MLALLLLVLLGGAPRPDTGYDQALELAAQGRLVAALEAADREPDSLRRAQARVYVLYRGRDFLGALAAARAGLQREPTDAWLLERAAACGLALRAPDIAREYAERLLEVPASGPLRDAAAAHVAAAEELERLDGLVAQGVRRARSTALALVALALAVLVFLAYGVAVEGRRATAPG